MIVSASPALLACFSLGASALFTPPVTYQPNLQRPLRSGFSISSWFTASDLGAWLHSEEEVATERLLANLAPDGVKAKGAAPGSVIASPSKGEPNQPDYFYQCKLGRG